MRAGALGNYDEKVSEPDPRGERVARFVDDYMSAHPGLTLGELAFRLKQDKRDLQRLVRERSSGWKLEDALAAYFGRIFGEAVFGPLWGDGPSRREKELEHERAQIAARRERLERDRSECRTFRPAAPALLRMASDEDRRGDV